MIVSIRHIEVALGVHRDPFRVVELGAGTGAIHVASREINLDSPAMVVKL